MSLVTAPTSARRPLAALLTALLAVCAPALSLFVAAPAQAAAPTLSFVGSASTTGNRTTHSVVVPAGVQAGDTLLVFLTTNVVTDTLGAPAGWTLVQSKDGAGSRGRVWTKTAGAGDAGSTVSLTSSVFMKSVMSITAYRSSLGTSSVTASAGFSSTSAGTSHSAPAVAVADPGSWLVSYWSEKSSNTLSWTPPASTTLREAISGTGGGKTSSLLADSGAAVPTGTAAARVATTSVATGGTQLFSVVVSPGADVPNHAPTAAFTANCPGLVCAFDATGSKDVDGQTLTYAWDFGDGTTGTGATPTHTYANATGRTVKLTVSDGFTTAQATNPVVLTAAEDGPGHTTLAPELPRTNLPKITDGEILDMKVLGNRVFVAGTFTKIANNASGNTTSYAQAGLASFNMDTGLVDASFRPTFGGGGVEAVEASPDGTKLYVAGTFKTINGVSKQRIARIDLTTGAPIAGFTANANDQVLELAPTNSTLYVGGRFSTVNGVARSALAAVDATTGAVDPTFKNDVTNGIGVNGGLAVQRLLLTHDHSKLLVVHTGRKVAGQDRYGMAVIDTLTGQLTSWRSHLWDDNLQFVGGVTRIVGAAIAPDDSYFVVTSGSGGDRPPISDTVVAFPFDGGADPSDVKPLWVSRMFDSVYSVAISEKAIYVGGHFAWNESPSAPDPWPGQDDIGYGTGQGLSGYALGDAVVNREHIGAINPVDGKALDWSPGSNSFEGNKTMEVTPRGVLTGGDAGIQGGYNIGRIAFYDFNTVPAPNGVSQKLVTPITGRVLTSGTPFNVTGTASATAGVKRVQLEVQNRQTLQYLQNDGTWAATWNALNTTLENPGATTTNWSIQLTVTGNQKLRVGAKAFDNANKGAPAKTYRNFETFGLSDAPPTATITTPADALVKSKDFTLAGNASDDKGVQYLTTTVKDQNGHYLQDDGSVDTTYNSFRVTPDVVGATYTTWSEDITVPTEGSWYTQTRVYDTAGNASLDTRDKALKIFANGQAPQATLTSPTTIVGPDFAKTITVEPGKPFTFSGSVTDDTGIYSVDVVLRNMSTKEQLAPDGTWQYSATAQLYRLNKAPINAKSYNYSYTTDFDLTPGSYVFYVLPTDIDGITPAGNERPYLTMNATVAGDAPPKAKLDKTGKQPDNLTDLNLALTGTATDDKGVSQVQVTLFDDDSGKYLKDDGTMSTTPAAVPATLASPGGKSTTWSLSRTLPTQGDWNVTATAYDASGQQDLTASGATARYLMYPGDSAPTFDPNLLQPAENAPFTDGRIFVSGRANDNQAMAKVDVAIINSAGNYLTSSGTFSSSVSWRSAFLTSIGTPGSNFSYTTPVVPSGNYTVQIRATDQHDLVSVPTVRHVTVSVPPGNNKPVAAFTKSCSQNVCTFDARSSTDENAATLTYAWTFGTGQGTDVGPVVQKQFTAPGTFTVTVVATDEYGVSSDPATTTVTITEPSGNVAPDTYFADPSCSGLVCTFTGNGTTDPNDGDVISYAWNFGDPSVPSKNVNGNKAATHTFTSAGTFTVTLTATDGWGRSKTVTKQVTVSP